VSLGLLRNLSKHALQIGAGLLSSDLAGHVDEALELLRIVRLRFGLARHGLRHEAPEPSCQRVQVRFSAHGGSCQPMERAKFPSRW
jgi:hypothetical protein